MKGRHWVTQDVTGACGRDAEWHGKREDSARIAKHRAGGAGPRPGECGRNLGGAGQGVGGCVGDTMRVRSRAKDVGKGGDGQGRHTLVTVTNAGHGP